MKVYRVTGQFPPTERSFIDQIRRSSRSVCANLGEVYGTRSYPKYYRSKMVIAISENFETQVWLDFALTTKYIDRSQYDECLQLAEEVGRLLTYMTQNPDKFRKWNSNQRSV